MDWTKNWDRAYRITLGTREYTEQSYAFYEEDVIEPSTFVTYETSTTIPSDAVIWGNLEVDGFDKRGFSFKFDSTQVLAKESKGSEKTTLTLYNLDDTMVTLINKDKCKVIVEAGYEESVEVAYTGDVMSVKKSRSGSDTLYVLTCESGGFAKTEAIGTVSYDESMSEADVMTDLIYRLGDTSPGTTGFTALESVYKTGGYAFSGKLIDEMEKWIARRNLQYVHINGKMLIVPKYLTDEWDDFYKTNYNLTLNTLKSVTKVANKGDTSVDDPTSGITKLQVSTFFLPIEPSQFITIPETDYTEETYGTYIVTGRRVVLDSMGSAWDVVLNVEEATEYE